MESTCIKSGPFLEPRGTIKHLVISMAIVAGGFLLQTCDAWTQVSVDVEGGIAFAGYNDVRIPGTDGSLFSLTSDFDTPPVPFFRGRVRYDIAERHAVMLLIAPLTFNGSRRTGKELFFQGKTYAADKPVDAEWKFNSYRLTYAYTLVDGDALDFTLGLTAKIRDAKIALSQGGNSSEKTDLGFVPLIYFRLEWAFHPDLDLLLDGDALAAPQGRAEDILCALRYRLSEQVRIRAGYRILEGGADNDTVYNFSLTHYAVAGVTISF